MTIKLIMALAVFCYKLKLRELLKKKIDNPESQVDEKVIAALDVFFYYKVK